jgi:hypothetical protein
MADYAISYADLSAINHNLNVLVRNLEAVSNQVLTVDQNVRVLYSDLGRLTQEFRNFVAEADRRANLQEALQRITVVEQKLQKEYGYYDEVRRHTTGILQATDISVVRKETIATSTEELMLSAPRYWLAPCLIALSAWISDNKELAERALKEAMKRDDEKTSLLFCLIARRAGRLNGSLVWLERYFGMQDPAHMERKVIIVLDAFASGLFGPDAKGACSEKIKAWIDELSSKVGFIETQKEQWEKAIVGKTASVNDNDFPNLSANSPTWPQLKAVMAWAKTHNDIYSYFSTIFNTIPDNVASITAQIDNLLDSLVTNYDDEELPLRKEKRRNELIVEENGDAGRAQMRFDSETPAFDPYENFSQHLTSVALAPESSGALRATQKLAISLSKEWIINAYEDLTAKSRSQIPTEIEIKLSDWIGITRDGSNEIELENSLKSYLHNKLTQALAKIKLNLFHWFGLCGGAILIVLGLISQLNLFLIILGMGGIIYFLIEKYRLKKNKEQTTKDMEEFKEKALAALKATIADTVDFRRLFAEKDADYKKVTDFLNGLSPQQYIAVGDGRVRQVL